MESFVILKVNLALFYYIFEVIDSDLVIFVWFPEYKCRSFATLANASRPRRTLPHWFRCVTSWTTCRSSSICCATRAAGPPPRRHPPSGPASASPRPRPGPPTPTTSNKPPVTATPPARLGVNCCATNLHFLNGQLLQRLWLLKEKKEISYVFKEDVLCILLMPRENINSALSKSLFSSDKIIALQCHVPSEVHLTSRFQIETTDHIRYVFVHFERW